MFLPHKMKKLDVIILKKYVDVVTQEILRFGDFEVLELSSSRLEGYALQQNKSDDMHERLQEFKRRAHSSLSFFHYENTAIPDDYNPEVLDENSIRDLLNKIESDVNKWSHDDEDLKKRQRDIQIKLDSIRFFGKLDMDLSLSQSVKHFHMGFGSVPSLNYQAFMNAFDGIPSVVQNVGTIGANNMVFFTVPVNSREKVEKVLHNLYYKEYGIPTDVKGNIKSNIVRYGFELTMTHDEAIWQEEMFARMSANYKEKLQQLRYSIEYHIARAHLQGEMASTQNVFLFSGWVTADQEQELMDAIEAHSDKRCVFLDEDAANVMARENITAPTKLKNPKVLKPFESLVSMFGTPNYNEIDPTPIAAITYVIMFGAMFGDIGQGLIISLLGGLLALIPRFKKVSTLGSIIFWVGISSTLFGLLYGSVFGNEHIMSEMFGNFFYAPLENINLILGAAIGFGVLMISTGIIMNLINCVRLKDYGKFFFSGTGLAGLTFYWGVLAVAGMALLDISYPSWLIYIPLTAIVVIGMEKRLEYWIFKHGERPGIGLGIFEVLESVLSFLSNTISFVRVGAFALNHGALMSVVFILADMAKSPIGKGIALVLGNLFVLGFEGMVVGIQALRLEYYEFFIKFFRADGKEFQTLDIYKHE